MCGIAGIVRFSRNPVHLSEIKNMSDVLMHRGPDGEGHWISADERVALAHRRLAIIDLSDSASQPMHYLDRYTITFNGEIYNYIELKEDLVNKGYRFATNSDTEVLLAMYDYYGAKSLDFLDGMFAFALYDDQKKELFCARDRFGEKPFYYKFKNNGDFTFASEMKAIHVAEGKPSVNNKMLFNYLAFGYMDNRTDLSETFFTDIQNLPQSSWLKLDISTATITVKKYWEINLSAPQTEITDISRNIQELFQKGLKRRMRSDVTVGSSLSGGLDSSLIVCLIRDMIDKSGNDPSLRNVQKTFSARFPGFARDEGDYMQMVISQTGVDPYFTYPSDKILLNEIDKVMYHQEEPFGSASIIVQYEVMKLAKNNNVTVLLDGQGADEIFAGYHGYYNVFFRELKKSDPAEYRREYQAYKHLQKSNTVNAIVKPSLAQYIRTYLPSQVDKLRFIHFFARQKREKYFNADFFAENRKSFVRFNNSFATLNEELNYSTMRGDLQILLRYADRNSMAHSREIRLPFLFHELVEFAFSLPASYKIHNGWTKWILRETFQSILPNEICWRKDKIGYEPPQKNWMANPVFKDKVFSATQKLVNDRILDKKVLDKMPSVHSAGERGNNEWAHLMVSYL